MALRATGALPTVGDLSPEELAIEVRSAWLLRQAQAGPAQVAACALLGHPLLRNPAELSAWRLRGYLRLILAESVWLNGALFEASMQAEEALEDFRAGRCSEGLSDVAWMQAGIASDCGSYDERRECVERSQSMAGDCGERNGFAVTALACFEAFEDPIRAAAKYGNTVLELLHSGPSSVRAHANSFMGIVSQALRRPADAVQYALASERDSEASGQMRRAIAEGATAAQMLGELGDMEGCAHHLERVVERARRSGWPNSLGRVLTVMARAMQSLGRLESARTCIDEAQSLLAMQSASKNYLCAVYTCADVALAEGDLGQAARGYSALADAPGSGDTTELKMFGIAGLANVEQISGRYDKAFDLSRQALDLSVVAGDVTLQVSMLRQMARAAAGWGTSSQDGPGGSQVVAAGDALLYLRRAVLLVDQYPEIDPKPELFDELAAQLEAAGHDREANNALRNAARIRASQASQAASKLVIALEVRYRTERALADAEGQRQLAEIESARARDLEDLNGRLIAAMDALRTTKDLLTQRNEELQRAYAQIQDLSLTDALTGLRNRRFLGQVIGADIAQCLRAHRQGTSNDPTGGESAETSGSPDILFFMLDLDHFKQVNDVHGHAAGDAVLVEIGKRLISATRDEDYVVRWGGEEFLVVARGAKRADAPAMAERLRLAFEGTPFALPGGQALLKTTSIGVAAFPLDASRPEQGGWEDAVEIADANLYRAKKEGRNRWVAS